MATTVERIEDLPPRPDDATYAVIDVLRFCTTATILLERGATSIRAVRSRREALQYKDETGAMLAGERDGETPDGFDMNNSPTQAEQVDIGGYAVGMVTSNGTRAVQRVADNPVILASTVNARAAANHLQQVEGDVVLLACGHKGNVADEDLVGAELIQTYLAGDEPTEDELQGYRRRIAGSDHAEELREQDFVEDITKAQRFDAHDTVPVLQGDVFRS